MVQFEWDEAKAISNLRKHGISFLDAVRIFKDPFCITEPERIVEGELRWQTTGSLSGVIILLVAHTLEDDEEEERVRIISARRATREEKERYEQERQSSIG
jgi:uncharacterized DUF497 family protein